jgi:predicted dehydrogenase
MNTRKKTNRRTFIRNLGIAGAAGFLAPGIMGSVPGSQFSGIASSNKNRKPGIALVGLGRYSSGQLAPALQETQYCRLSGIVTGTPSKEDEWMRKYDIPKENVYNYDNFDSIADNDDIDIIYVVLPNSMHAEYTIRAAKAGKHVICEKPMATSVKDSEDMIRACNDNDVKLSLGYRLHFEPYNLRAMELGQTEVFGPVQNLDAATSFVINDWEWRLDKDLAGGGPLMDVGIYTVQAACYNMGQWPVEVSKATYGEVTRPELFKSVEQSITFTLKYPNGVTSTHSSSYANNASYLDAVAKNGWWKLDPAYYYGNIGGVTSEGPMKLPNVNQQARQMDAFALSLMEDTPILVPGDMGLRDMKILMAIYESADTGKPVKLDLDNLNIPKYDLHRRVNNRLKTSM